jgi:uncharacterized protein (DUF58 family)
VSTAPANYLDPEVVSRLAGLDLKARMIVEGYVAGRHKSPFHGFSVEFAEHREYVPGDDLRHVDWKIFGRSDRFYLKQYEEETNFACHLLLDASESMKYRSESVPLDKLEYAKLVSAALAYLVLQQQDAVGVTTFDSDVRALVRSSSYGSHFKQICHVLEQTRPSGESRIGPLLHSMAERIRKRGLILILSDLFDDLTEFRLGLKHLRHRRHEVIVMQVVDPAEVDFPFQDPTLFKGLEIPREEMIDPRSLQRAYREEFAAFLREVRGICRDLHVEHVLLKTDADLGQALSGFLSARASRGLGG